LKILSKRKRQKRQAPPHLNSQGPWSHRWGPPHRTGNYHLAVRRKVVGTDAVDACPAQGWSRRRDRASCVVPASTETRSASCCAGTFVRTRSRARRATADTNQKRDVVARPLVRNRKIIDMPRNTKTISVRNAIARRTGFERQGTATAHPWRGTPCSIQLALRSRIKQSRRRTRKSAQIRRCRSARSLACLSLNPHPSKSPARQKVDASTRSEGGATLGLAKWRKHQREFLVRTEPVSPNKGPSATIKTSRLVGDNMGAVGSKKRGLLEIEWAILGVQIGGSIQERTLRRRYSSSFRPYARR
jgi:hypothetical protein